MNKDTIDIIAQVCYAANSAFSLAIKDPGINFSSIAPWNELSEGQKDLFTYGVKRCLEDTEAKPEEIHAIWKNIKVGQGWVYGPNKCEIQKTHPCICEYKELSKEEKLKDVLFMNIVKAFKGSLDGNY